MMKSNFMALRELLEKYNPEERGVLMPHEVKLIKETLQIEMMKEKVDLQNLRDFVVIFLGHKDDMKSWDQMSAITHIIDNEMMERF